MYMILKKTNFEISIRSKVIAEKVIFYLWLYYTLLIITFLQYDNIDEFLSFFNYPKKSSNISIIQ